MPPEAQPAAAAAKQPYADLLLNVGKPSLSADSDMPVIDLAKPNQEQVVDGAADALDTGDTSGKTGVEADAEPQTKVESGVEGKEQPTPQQRAALTREKSRRQAAEQRAQSLESGFATQIAELTNQISKLTEGQKPKDDLRPSRESFDTPEAHDSALIAWAERRAEEKAKTEAQAEQERQGQERQRQTIMDGFNERRARFEADHPDFEDVVFADDVKISPAMTQALLEAEDGPQVAYYLGQNPEIAERLSGLSPAQAVYEIGKISVKLANPPKARPEPIRPLQSRSNSGVADPNDESMDEYGARRTAELRKKSN